MPADASETTSTAAMPTHVVYIIVVAIAFVFFGVLIVTYWQAERKKDLQKKKASKALSWPPSLDDYPGGYLVTELVLTCTPLVAWHKNQPLASLTVWCCMLVGKGGQSPRRTVNAGST